MTFQDLYKLCQRQTGNRTPDGLVGFQTYLNLAQKRVAGSMENWPELQSSSTLSLVQGTEEYSLAADFESMRKIVITTTGYEGSLTKQNYLKFRSMYPNTDNDPQARPFIWYFSPNSAPGSIRVHPIPDTSYAVTYDYIAIPSDMTADTDTPFFPARWHHILVDAALAMYYESAAVAQFDKSAYYETKFVNDIALMRADLVTRSSDEGMADFDGQEVEG